MASLEGIVERLPVGAGDVERPRAQDQLFHRAIRERVSLGGAHAQALCGTGGIEREMDEPRRQERQHRQRDDGEDGAEEDGDACRQIPGQGSRD